MAYSFGKVVDTLLAFRIVKLLVQSWEDMDAYKLGIIDKEGNFLKKTRDLKTVEEKRAFTKFHVIMFRLKKVLEKLPFGKTKLGSIAVALMLLKEETGTIHHKDVESIVCDFLKETDSSVHINTLCEHLEMDAGVQSGRYTLMEETITTDGDVVPAGTRLIVSSGIVVGSIFGINVYEALTENLRTVYVTRETVSE